MDVNTISLVWFILGIVLMIAELILPGGVSFFLGLSAVIVSISFYFGFLTSLWVSVAYWLILASLLLLFIGYFLLKIFPGDVSHDITEEDADAIGKEVRVIEKISPENCEGRIRFRGTSWKAKSLDDIIEKGDSVKILHRENAVWIVDVIK